MWDLTTALDFFNKNEKNEQQNQGLPVVNKTAIPAEQGGPTTQELVSAQSIVVNIFVTISDFIVKLDCNIFPTFFLNNRYRCCRAVT